MFDGFHGLLFVFLFLLSIPASGIGLMARPECLEMVLFSLLLASLGSGRPIARVTCLVVAFLVPWNGLQWVFLIGCFVFFLWLFADFRFSRLCFCAAGMLAGVGAVLLFYHVTGMWDPYHREIARAAGDSSVVLMAFGHLSALLRGDMEWLTHYIPATFWWQWLGVAGCMVLAKPLNLAMDTRRVLRMAAVTPPVALGGLAVLAHLLPGYLFPFWGLFAAAYALVFRDVARGHSILVCLLLIFLVLLPMRGGWLHFKYADDPWGQRRHRPMAIDKVLAAVVLPDDVVVCNDALYYAVRGRAKDWYPLRRALCDGFPAADITLLAIGDHPVRSRKIWLDHVLNECLDRHFSPDDSVPLPDFLRLLEREWHCSFQEIDTSALRTLGEGGYRCFRKMPGADTNVPT